VWDVAKTGKVYAKPAVAGGIVYFGTGEGTLLALDAKTGDELWAFQAAGDMVCNPTPYDGRVYFGSGSKLYALQ